MNLQQTLTQIAIYWLFIRNFININKHCLLNFITCQLVEHKSKLENKCTCQNLDLACQLVDFWTFKACTRLYNLVQVPYKWGVGFLMSPLTKPTRIVISWKGHRGRTVYCRGYQVHERQSDNAAVVPFVWHVLKWNSGMRRLRWPTECHKLVTTALCPWPQPQAKARCDPGIIQPARGARRASSRFCK